jgi:hypothetical protein
MVDFLLHRKQQIEQQQELVEEEENVRQQVLQAGVEGFVDVLRQRVHFEAGADLMRVYCSLKADPLRENRFTCATFKVPRTVPFKVLVGLLQRRFKQDLLLTFMQPVTNLRAEERLLTPFNIDEMREVGHVVAPKCAPKPCHIPTVCLTALVGKINPTLPSPFLPPVSKLSPTDQPPKKPLKQPSPLHDRLYDDYAVTMHKKEELRKAVHESDRQANGVRTLTPLEQRTMVDRMYTERMRNMQETAAMQRRAEEEDTRRRQIVISASEAADQVQRLYKEGMEDQVTELKGLQKKWQPPLKTKTLQELNGDVKDLTGRLYERAADHKTALRKKLYDEIYKSTEPSSGILLSEGERQQVFSRLYEKK